MVSSGAKLFAGQHALETHIPAIVFQDGDTATRTQSILHLPASQHLNIYSETTSGPVIPFLCYRAAHQRPATRPYENKRQ